MSAFNRFVEHLFNTAIQRQVKAQLSVLENDASFSIGAYSLTDSERDRYTADREELLFQSLDAWRLNPLARRIVELTSEYVVGSGISVSCRHAPTARFLDQFWNHHLNRMPIRVFELCDELTRSGNLFMLLSTDESGMTYLRAIPAVDILKIEARENDIEQPVAFFPKSSLQTLDPEPYPAYDPLHDDLTTPVMLQYAINRPAGGQWGESDLSPLLRWLSRYTAWLEDRARLNRYRNAFLYIVQAKFNSEAQRKQRQQTLNSHPPKPGSILVTDDTENWKVINPHLHSAEANEDGLALKKMIACGAGIPLHFLAEPESSTRTTAEAAGGPTFRRFQQRQEYFLWMLTDILRVVIERRARLDPSIDPHAIIELSGTDISARDNSELASAAADILSVAMELRDRELIDDAEFLRLVYRFTGESVNVPDLLARGRKTKQQDGLLPR
ncbi:MAG: hypothetical protein GYA45_04835 [Pelolinea sp.]|nr:hypothetical protein [Pelolinea sp.]